MAIFLGPSNTSTFDSTNRYVNDAPSAASTTADSNLYDNLIYVEQSDLYDKDVQNYNFYQIEKDIQTVKSELNTTINGRTATEKKNFDYNRVRSDGEKTFVLSDIHKGLIQVFKNGNIVNIQGGFFRDSAKTNLGTLSYKYCIGSVPSDCFPPCTLDTLQTCVHPDWLYILEIDDSGYIYIKDLAKNGQRGATLDSCQMFYTNLTYLTTNTVIENGDNQEYGSTAG